MKLLKHIALIAIIGLSLTSCKKMVDKSKDSNTLNPTVQDAGLVIDVRTPEEYQSGHIPGAINIDWKDKDTFNKKIKSVPKDRTVLVYCHSGHRSGQATQFLKEQGYEKIYNLATGIMGWKAANYDIEK
jgi:rhodanese-related sulfurtransferase